MNEGSKTSAAELVSLRKKLAGKNYLSGSLIFFGFYEFKSYTQRLPARS